VHLDCMVVERHRMLAVEVLGAGVSLQLEVENKQHNLTVAGQEVVELGQVEV
jgi:hypothetical protein